MKNAKYHIEFDIDFKRNKYPGKFIVIEGNEGSGKSVQIESLFKSLQKEGYKVVRTKEPTDMPVGKIIRNEVLSGKIKVPPQTLQYLYCADRAMHLEKVEQLLKKGFCVISDRYFWSSVAYGTADVWKDEDDFYLMAYSLLSMYHRFLTPDITFYLHIDFKTAMKRIKASHKHKEIYDNEKMWPRIEKGYEFLLKKFPKEIVRINGDRSIDEVTKEMVKRIKKI